MPPSGSSSRAGCARADAGARGEGARAKRIARELALARNTQSDKTVPARGPAARGPQPPTARHLDEVARVEALALFDGDAERNAVVVADILAQRGVGASVRTVQRIVADRRREHLAADLATVRFETAPDRQMQIDFGERKAWIAGRQVTVHFLVAVLSYSRRIFRYEQRQLGRKPPTLRPLLARLFALLPDHCFPR
jgi:transposase